MFLEIMKEFNNPFTDLRPYAPASDRKAWADRDKEWLEGTLQLSREYSGFSLPYLSATDFMDFSRTGNRSRYEEKYFSKRRALAALVLAECAEDSGRFTDDIINGIFSICDESAWQLPAHNTYIRDAVQLPLPDVSEPIIELFACETGASLATACYLLGDKLDEACPFIRKRVSHELMHRVIRPYLDRHFWWMGNGMEPMCNWTIWCTQNILLTFFLTDLPDDIRRAAFEKACRSIDYFLDEYGDDGCCDEGAQYYRHAGLCLFNSIEILNAVTGGAFESLYDKPLIKNIAAYIYNVHVSGEYYINFADCSPIAGRAGAREFLFAQRTHNAPMAAFAAEDFMAGGTNSLLLPDEINLYYRLQNAFTVKEIKKHSLSAGAPQNVCPPDIFYQSTGLFIARDDTFCLAVKAGDNADSHNHNDTGSFTIYKNGLPLFIDAGVGTYTKKTFSPQRYEIWTMQSAYHNLPTIGGFMQQDGEEFAARDTVYSFSDEKAEISMDIAGAYPPGAPVVHYQRKAVLVKGKRIIIEDTFELSADPGTVVLSFMTYERPSRQDSPDCLSLDIGGAGRLLIRGGRLIDTDKIPIDDERLSIAWKHAVYRTLIAAEDNTITMEII